MWVIESNGEERKKKPVSVGCLYVPLKNGRKKKENDNNKEAKYTKIYTRVVCVCVYWYTAV
jgi:hypothetical protein